MDSLLFQTNNGTGISIIDAKSNKKFIGIYDKYKIIIKPKIVLNKDANILCNRFKKYRIFNDYRNIDFFERLEQHLNKFNSIKDLNKLEPLYLKNPVE